MLVIKILSALFCASGFMWMIWIGLNEIKQLDLQTLFDED